MKQATASLRKQYVKAYLKLLTQAAENVDNYFFDDESDDDSEVKPFFYAAILCGVFLSLFVLFKTL